MNRWLGIDPGSRRVGVAVGSAPDGIVTPLEVLPAEPADGLIAGVAGLARQYGAKGIAVGWALNMDGSEGPQGRESRSLAIRLQERTGLDVRLWDERLSSFAADQALAGRLTRKKRKARHDALAAAHMLAEFLAGDGPNTAPRPRDAVPPSQAPDQ